MSAQLTTSASPRSVCATYSVLPNIWVNSERRLKNAEGPPGASAYMINALMMRVKLTLTCFLINFASSEGPKQEVIDTHSCRDYEE